MNSVHVPSSPVPNYLEKYALRRAPFENHVDRKCFYGGTALMQRLDLLAHLTQFGEPLALVMGPPGSGKSTMLGQFVERANNRWYLCCLGRDTLSQLPNHLSHALGGVDTSAGMEGLLDRWDTETDASQLFVIIIDDAEQLEAQACRMLCELLDKPQGERIRVILFGTAAMQPLIKDALTELASNRSPQVLEVPRLSEEETAAYLMYRLAVAGYSGESPFSSIEIRAICKAADGWPGAVNHYAHETLTEHIIRARGKRQLPQKSAFGNYRQLWLAAPVVLLIAMIYLGWQHLYAPAPNEIEARTQDMPLALPVPRPAENEAPASPSVALDSARIEQKRSIEVPRETPATAAPQLPEQPVLTTTVPLPLPAHDSASPSEDTQPSETLEPKPTARAKAPPADPVEAQQESSPTPTTAAISLAAPAPATPPEATTPRTTPPPAGGPHREAWLLEQPGEHFSLQLLGSRSEKLLTDFIRRHKLDLAQTAYYRGLHKGSDWFVLMYGLYPSREAALAGLASLPSAVRKTKPWPRQMQAVQQLVREANP